MKLGTLKSSSRDGELIVVSRDGRRAVKATPVAANLRTAIENWERCAPALQDLYAKLNAGDLPGIFTPEESKLHSPLPRSFQWADGSAFIHHIKLVRMARNAQPPETLETVPLIYQGGSDTFLAPTEDIPQIDPSHGTDFEGEVGVIVGDTPAGITPEKALEKIILLVLINDVTLRGLTADELAQGFGFFQSKPQTAFAPFAITPDELGNAWKDGRVHLPLNVDFNGEFFGNADAGVMHFHFGQLIAHAARTRPLMAGTIIGSGTVSNEDRSRGSSCLVERRMLEKIHEGVMKTPFMKVGDTVKIEMLSADGTSLFGRIKQTVAQIKI